MKILIFLSLFFFLFYRTANCQTDSSLTPPEFSAQGGFYKDSLTVVLLTDNPLEAVYYTTDGSLPNNKSLIYVNPLSVRSTSVIRARSYLNDSVFSMVKTNSYFINEKTTLPVVSVSTDPANLWNSKIGIYVQSVNIQGLTICRIGRDLRILNYMKRTVRKPSVLMRESEFTGNIPGIIRGNL